MYTGWISFPILRLNSPSCLRTEFADLWSLNGNIILTGAFLLSQVCLDLTSPAFRLSSSWQLFHLECERLKETFSRLHYPVPLLQSSIKDFVTANVSGDVRSKQTCDDKKAPVRIILPFKDQRSANSVRRQLGDFYYLVFILKCHSFCTFKILLKQTKLTFTDFYTTGEKSPHDSITSFNVKQHSFPKTQT